MLDSPIYQELTRYKARRHHHTRAETRKQAPEACLPCESAEAIEHCALWPMALVYLRQQRVCGLGEDSSGKTSDNTAAKRDG
jgi:hypothetical protein